MRLLTVLAVTFVMSLIQCELAAADPVTYRLSQSGWTGGGEINGLFEGEDLNNDGFVSLDAGELSAYAVHFSGNTVVPDFTHNLADLRFFRYALGTSGFPPSFPLFSENGSFFYDADDKVIGGRGFTAPFITTLQAGAVTAIAPTPEPISLLLLGTGAAAA